VKFQLLALPIALATLTACGTIDRLNCLVNQSTESISANAQAVQWNTCVVQQNAQLVQETNRAIEENRRLLEAVSK